MKQTKLIMGMPIIVEIPGIQNVDNLLTEVFDYFTSIDNKYSTYKEASEISKINNGLQKELWSQEMKEIFELCEQTKKETAGFFDILRPDGKYDPSGLAKGWAIQNATSILHRHNIANFYIEAGGDIQVHGLSSKKQPWRIGIRNPFNTGEIIKTITLSNEGIATSGSYIRGQHIYNPLKPSSIIKNVKSITVIGPNIYDADRFATAAFAMDDKGVMFIESLPGFEAYMIDKDKIATYTSGFKKYEAKDV